MSSPDPACGTGTHIDHVPARLPSRLPVLPKNFHALRPLRGCLSLAVYTAVHGGWRRILSAVDHTSHRLYRTFATENSPRGLNVGGSSCALSV